MESVSDIWSEQPLDLVKKKIPVAVVAPSAILKRVGDAEEAKSDQEVIKAEEVYPRAKDEWTPKCGPPLQEEDSGVGTPSPVDSAPGRRDAKYCGATDIQGDMSQIALQSPNLYSALCKDSKDTAKETPAVSAAHMEMLDKLTAEYVQKMAVQGVPDALKPDGLYTMIHRLAALENKFLSALYMGSLGYTPGGMASGLHPGMTPRVPTPTGLLGALPLPYLSPTMLPYQNFLVPSSSAPENRLNSTDTQLRLKQMLCASPPPSQAEHSSTASSTSASASASTSSTKSTDDFVSSSSSVRSSSASSPLDLALSPMSSVRASPPLTPLSTAHRKPSSAKRYLSLKRTPRNCESERKHFEKDRRDFR